MKAMCLLNVLLGQVGENIKMKQQKTRSSELMYMDVKLNSQTTCAIIDMSVTHNFIIDREAKQLGLNLEKSLSEGSKLES